MPHGFVGGVAREAGGARSPHHGPVPFDQRGEAVQMLNEKSQGKSVLRPSPGTLPYAVLLFASETNGIGRFTVCVCVLQHLAHVQSAASLPRCSTGGKQMWRIVVGVLFNPRHAGKYFFLVRVLTSLSRSLSLVTTTAHDPDLI